MFCGVGPRAHVRAIIFGHHVILLMEVVFFNTLLACGRSTHRPDPGFFAGGGAGKDNMPIQGKPWPVTLRLIPLRSW